MIPPRVVVVDRIEVLREEAAEAVEPGLMVSDMVDGALELVFVIVLGSPASMDAWWGTV